MQNSLPDSSKFRGSKTTDNNRPTLTLLSRAEKFPKDNLVQSSGAATPGDELETFKELSGPSVHVAVDVIREYYSAWVDDCIAEAQSKRTTDAKRESIERFLWFLDRAGYKRAGLFEIRRFLSHAKNGHTEPLGRWEANTTRAFKPVGGRAVQIYFVHIRGFFDWLVEYEFANGNPLAGKKQPKATKNMVSPLSIEEVAMLLAAIPRVLNRVRNEAMIYFLLDTGVRVSELCSLTIDDIDLARRVAVVTGKGNKTREVWFGPDTARVLRKYLTKWPREGGQSLFYSERTNALNAGLTPSGVQRTLLRLARFAGLSGRRVSPHNFRHTFATEFIKSGGSPKALQMLLGHEDMTMTYRYVTLAESDAAAQHRQHSPARLLRVKPKKK